MFQKFTATIRKWKALPPEEVRNVISWLDSEQSTFDFDNPNLLIGCARDESGKPVAYYPIEQMLVLSDYVFRPKLTEKAAGDAGVSMDSTIVREAQQRGVGRVLIALPNEVPHQADERQIRFLERKIQTVTMQEFGYSPRAVLFN